jgi:hypothetical protein
MRIRRPPALAFLLSLCVVLQMPAAAHAAEFFVDQGGSGAECTEAAPCATISQALAASRAAPGAGDRIEVGPGLYEERVVIDKGEDSGLTLHGAGRGPDQEATPAGATTVRAPEPNKGDEVAITNATGVKVEALRVEVPAGFFNTAGISLGAPASTVRDVHVQDAGGINTDAILVTPSTPDALIQNARIRQGEARGIAIFGPGATVVDSDVHTTIGQALDTEPFAQSPRIIRTRLSTDGSYVATIRTTPDVVIDSSLLTGGQVGLEAYANFSGTTEVTLSNDTIDVGIPKADDKFGVATRARAESGGTASISLVNSIALERQEVEGEAMQSISCDTSIVPLQEAGGPKGTIECGAARGNLAAPASSVFASGADWHLIAGSPAVDSGTGGDPHSTADLDGNPRVVDGTRDGIAVIDRGAYELPTPPPPGPAAVQPSNSFSFGKLKRNKRKGTAKLEVNVPGPGSLALSGKKVKKAGLDVGGAGTFLIAIVPKQKLARTLRKKGSAKTSIEVSFTPTGGTAASRTKKVKLVRKAG